MMREGLGADPAVLCCAAPELGVCLVTGKGKGLPGESILEARPIRYAGSLNE